MSRNFPLLKSLLPIAALVAAFSGVASAETCTGFKWSVATELSWVAAPDAEAVETGGKIVSIPDKAIELTLEPSPSVKLPATPGIKKQAIAKNSFSGWFSIADVGKPGLYQITIPSHAWIDVVQNDALVSTVAFSGDKNCKSLRKSVQYDLGAGPAIIQISGAPDKSMKLTIHAAEKK
ncbi:MULTISPECIES: hypothetical protein [unclassified Hyphomicrobium]|uniref:hypothetical protein n=1 Tax=unclassified Hyphomicrobium TaxID=2619925 RepID=UPI000213E947|nr:MULTISPECIES: hypothetical protein [unclassified Hyphomicrobium]CCB67197.1 conserved exported protein of unknown function [Hyphomicrobium sp. MC1]